VIVFCRSALVDFPNYSSASCCLNCSLTSIIIKLYCRFNKYGYRMVIQLILEQRVLLSVINSHWNFTLIFCHPPQFMKNNCLLSLLFSAVKLITCQLAVHKAWLRQLNPTPYIWVDTMDPQPWRLPSYVGYNWISTFYQTNYALFKQNSEIVKCIHLT